MYNQNLNGDNGLATQNYIFKYVETTFIGEREISSNETTWTADNLADYYRFRDLWQDLKAFDERYDFMEVDNDLEDGESMVILYNMHTDYDECVGFTRGISYKIAE